MDVPLHRATSGCLWWPAVIASFGLVLLITKMVERSFVARMDDDGFTTRGGKRIAWREVTSVRRVQTLLNGRLASDALRLTSARGSVSLPLSRTDNPAAVYDYAISRLPASVQAG